MDQSKGGSRTALTTNRPFTFRLFILPSQCPGHGDNIHLFDPRPPQHLAALDNRAPGGINIVEQQNLLTPHRCRIVQCKRTTYIILPLRRRERHLWLRPASTSQVVDHQRNPPDFGQGTSEKNGLVEPPLPKPPSMKRHRKQYVCSQRYNKEGK